MLLRPAVAACRRATAAAAPRAGWRTAAPASYSSFSASSTSHFSTSRTDGEDAPAGPTAAIAEPSSTDATDATDTTTAVTPVPDKTASSPAPTFPANLRLDDPAALAAPSPLDAVGSLRSAPAFLDNGTQPLPYLTPTVGDLTLDVASFDDNASPSVAQVTLDPAVFAVPVRRDIVQRVVQWQLAKRRQGTHRNKDISEVSGSGRKPWKQKGTGRARAGHIRPPHWRGGARAHPKRPRNYGYKLQKRVRNQGLRSALSAKVLEGAIHVVDPDTLPSHKTAHLQAWLAERELDSVLVVDGPECHHWLELAAGNIPQVDVLPQQGANVYDIVRRRDLILTTRGVEALTERVMKTGRNLRKKKSAVGSPAALEQ